MPNNKPLIRSIDWKIAKEKMPNSVSRHLPDGDPSQNHEEIKREIDRMIAIGPSGRNVTKQYVDGNINEQELEDQLNRVSQEVDNEELEAFRRNLRIIRDETRLPVWKEMIPLIYRVDMNRIRKAAERLNEVQKDSTREETRSKNTIKN